MPPISLSPCKTVTVPIKYQLCHSLLPPAPNVHHSTPYLYKWLCLLLKQIQKQCLTLTGHFESVPSWLCMEQIPWRHNLPAPIPAHSRYLANIFWKNSNSRQQFWMFHLTCTSYTLTDLILKMIQWGRYVILSILQMRRRVSEKHRHFPWATQLEGSKDGIWLSTAQPCHIPNMPSFGDFLTPAEAEQLQACSLVELASSLLWWSPEPHVWNAALPQAQ